MKRHHQILAGILGIQVILSIFVLWPRSVVTGEGTPIFPGLEAEDIVALTIADSDGNSIALRGVGEGWGLPEADDYPVQGDKITPLLDKIVSLTTSRLVTRTAASHKRLRVSADDFVRRLEFETADGTKYTFYLGSSPTYSSTHFRVDGQNETYLTDQITDWETGAEANSWVDTAYLRVSDEDIIRMTLDNANGSFTFAKDDEGEWTMAGLAAGETLDEVEVTNTMRNAASLDMVEPLGKEELDTYGLDEPNAAVSLETSEKTITLRVGAEDPDDKTYVVISSESPYYVRVSEFSVKELVERTREDFLQQPPTPTPEEETSSS